MPSRGTGHSGSRGGTGKTGTSSGNPVVWDIKMIEPAKQIRNGKARLVFSNGDIWEGQPLAAGSYLPSGTGQYTIVSTGSIYKGNFEEGSLMGEGEVIYANGDRLVGSWLKDGCEGTLVYHDGDAYTGGLDRGMRHGYGVCEYASGVRYEGHWKRDKRSGEGVILFPNGDRIEGEWANNMIKAGEGRHTSPNNDVYQGEMCTRAAGAVTAAVSRGDDEDGQQLQPSMRASEVALTVIRHGTGICWLVCGDVYEGAWVEGKAEGEGRIQYADGTFFQGSFVGGEPFQGQGMTRTDDWEYNGGLMFGKRDGVGECEWSDGSRYEGEWLANQRSGQGIMENADGVGRYEGGWLNDIRHGKGIAVLHDGSKYSGEFVDDKPHGKGRIEFQDGKVYEGDFVSSMPEGVGQITFPWGDVFCEFFNSLLAFLYAPEDQRKLTFSHATLRWRGKMRQSKRPGKVEMQQWRLPLVLLCHISPLCHASQLRPCVQPAKRTQGAEIRAG